MNNLSTNAAPKLPCDIVAGDIGRLAVEGGPWLAVVSSDDNYLSHGGGCSKAIWRAAKLRSPDELGVATPVRLGDVVPTKAGALPASALFHVVTLDLNTRQAMTPDLSGRGRRESSRRERPAGRAGRNRLQRCGRSFP